MVFLQSSPITPSTRGCWCWKCPPWPQPSAWVASCWRCSASKGPQEYVNGDQVNSWQLDKLYQNKPKVFYQKIKDKTFWRFTIKMSSSEKFHLERSRRKRIFFTSPWAVGPARSRQTSSSCQPAHPSSSPSSDRTLARTHCSTSRAWSSLTCRQSSGEVNVAL